MKSSFVASLMLVLLLCSIVVAEVPQLLNYQGRLTDTNGDPLNGSFPMEFRIYTALTGGSQVWTESHASVTVTEGVYQVLLGSVTPFSADLFSASTNRYLEIIIDSQLLSPRTRFTSVSYALKTAHSDSAGFASTAASAASAAPVGTAGGDLAGTYPSPTVDAIRGRTVATTAPTADQVLKWTGSQWAPADDVAGGGSVWQSSGNNIYYNAGNVGINTTTPSTELQVNGIITGTSFSGSGAGLTALNASNLSTGTIPSARFSGTYTSAVDFSNASNSFTGSGAGLTGISASNLGTGTLPSGRLSGAYSGNISLTNSSNTIMGNGSGLTGLSADALSSGTVDDARLETTINRTNFVASASISALDFITASGGVHVGGTSDPNNNLIVDGLSGFGGITSPVAPVHIKAVTDYGVRFVEDGTGTEYFDIGIDNSGNLEFRTDENTLALTLEDGTGHVGVNTDPSHPLHVYTGTTNANGIFIDHNGYASGDTRGLHIDHDNSGTGYTHGIYIDVDNAYTGNSWSYGIRSDVTNNGGTYGAQGIQSNVNGTSTGNKYGVYGNAYGSGDNYGIRGVAGGSATNYGGWFSAQGGTDDFGIYATGDKHYFYGNVGMGTLTPIYPLHVFPGSATRGIYVDHDHTTSGTIYGVYVDVDNTYTSTGSTYGGNFAASKNSGTSPSYGVRGTAAGTSTGTKYGVYGYSSGSGTRYAGYFNGYLFATTSSAGVKAFKIDHPLDPENKYLYHSSIESPDMMNVYNGNVILDSKGEAWVELPNYFEALNKDFRYQLTCIGGFAQVYIAEKVNNNRFKIAGGNPGLEISWQVTGIRQDPVAEHRRITVEVNKTETERGKYLDAEAYGQPRTRAVDYDPAEEEE